VCHPYKYSTHFFINNIKSVTGLVYLIWIMSSFTFGMILELRICWTPLKIQIMPNTTGYSSVYISYTVVTFILFISIVYLLIRIWKELKLMAARNRPEDRLVISASKYIIWSYLVYQVNIFVIVFFVVCQTYFFLPELSNATEAVGVIFMSMYGIVNIFMFVYFHPKYIDRVKKIFRLDKCSHRAVRPETIN